MATFTAYTGSGDTTLTDALLAPNSGVTIVDGSITLSASGPDAVSFYDGSLAQLGIDAGLLLTSGTVPGTYNTVGWFGQDNSGTTGFYNGDANIDAVVNTVFQTQSYDATTLSFDFTVADPTATSVSFDIVFGSDEFPEWVDQFVDCATVMVNGVNYALFNHDPLHPLSVVSSNLAAGYFQDNAGNVLPIEYDGVSHVLTIVAPIISGGVNHIEIGIADTGDHIYDSGIFISNLSAGNIPGSGVVITASGSGTDNSDSLTGSAKDEYFDLKGGDDICYAGAGDDIVVAGSGNDLVYGGSGADQLKGDAGDDDLDGGDGSDTAVFSGISADYAISYDGASASFAITDNSGLASDGADTLTNVEFAKFSDGLFALGAGGLTPVADPATPPSNTPGTVVITGIGAEGKTLTATVSDPDGISAGTVSYQWQVSSDNGTTWSDVGDGSNTYSIAAADVGNTIQVIASYVDDGSQAESPVSAAKSILASGNGDLNVTLMQLDAPPGSSVINPLTTLVQDAIDLGLSPNMAAFAVKTVLGLPANVNLQTYDAWSVLQGNPSDPAALAVEEIAVQVAILTSLSDDDTGVNLTLAILNAAANDQTLNLADANDIASILGIDITGIINPNGYPQPLQEIFDRNKSMADAIADGGDVSDIEAQWHDLLTIQDGINSTSIADLNIHVNQAPTGSATAALAPGSENAPYILSASDLLQGFSDGDGGTLSVSGITADAGAVTDNGDGTYSVTPSPNYVGPVELTYTVVDGQGGGAQGSQLFVIEPANHAPTGTATAALAAGSEDTPYVVDAAQLLAGFSDADGDPLAVTDLSASDGTVVDNGDGSYTITPTANYNGAVNLSYNVSDGSASIAATQSYALAAMPGLTLTGTAGADTLNGGADDDALYGLGGKDTLNGNAENDVLDGGAGSDKMFGGAGNDTYYVNATGDVVTEAASAGHDIVISSSSAYTLGANVEDLTLGGTAAINGTGNTLANILFGNDAANILSGLAGNDILEGGAGNDKLIGGASDDALLGGSGADVFRFDKTVLDAATNIDTILDFTAADDAIELENAVFLSLKKTGPLSAANFRASADGTAADGNDCILYNTGSGALYYDADGSGAAAPIQFATLTGEPSVTAADFFVT